MLRAVTAQLRRCCGGGRQAGRQAGAPPAPPPRQRCVLCASPLAKFSPPEKEARLISCVASKGRAKYLARLAARASFYGMRHLLGQFGCEVV